MALPLKKIYLMGFRSVPYFLVNVSSVAQEVIPNIASLWLITFQLLLIKYNIIIV